MQLVAYGAQDALTGNPQITFFKVVYRRIITFQWKPSNKTDGTVGTGASTVSAVSKMEI